MQVENPLGAATTLEVKWKDLPGDLQVVKAEGGGKVALAGHAVARETVRVAGHLDGLPVAEQIHAIRMELGEKTAGAMLELPVTLPVYRMHPTREPPTIDGKGKDWPKAANAVLQAYGPMTVATRYLSRGDLLKGEVRVEGKPGSVEGAETGASEAGGAKVLGASVKWTYDSDYIYTLITCPQENVSDQRTSVWPVLDRRWWATDGVQVQIAGGPRLEAGVRIVQIGIKPSGTVLTKCATVGEGGVSSGKELLWSEGGVTGMRFGVVSDPRAVGGGYVVELAIPRKWFANDHDKDANVPCWRVNVLRHRVVEEGGSGVSTSWSGPVVDDGDVAMMGLLLGGGGAGE